MLLTNACSDFLQVFDATNTTRERRELILNFGKENDFKVSDAPWRILGFDFITSEQQRIYPFVFLTRSFSSNPFAMIPV